MGTARVRLKQIRQRGTKAEEYLKAKEKRGRTKMGYAPVRLRTMKASLCIERLRPAGNSGPNDNNCNYRSGQTPSFLRSRVCFSCHQEQDKTVAGEGVDEIFWEALWRRSKGVTHELFAMVIPCFSPVANLRHPRQQLSGLAAASGPEAAPEIYCATGTILSAVVVLVVLVMRNPHTYHRRSNSNPERASSLQYNAGCSAAYRR